MCDDCSDSTSTSDTSCDTSSDISCDTTTDTGTDTTPELPEDTGDLSNDGAEELPDDSGDDLDSESVEGDDCSEEVVDDETESVEPTDVEEEKSDIEEVDSQDSLDEPADDIKDNSLDDTTDNDLPESEMEKSENDDLHDDGSEDLPDGALDSSVVDDQGNLRVMNNEEYLSLSPEQQDLFEQKYNTLSQEEKDAYDKQFAQADLENYNRHVNNGDYNRNDNTERDLQDIIDGQYQGNDDYGSAVCELGAKGAMSAVGTSMGLDPVTKADLTRQAGDIGRIYGPNAMENITRTAYVQNGIHTPTPIVREDKYGNKTYDYGQSLANDIQSDSLNNLNNIYTIDCRNSDLVGNVHPVTGVPFESRQITVGDDVYGVVSPEFEAKYDFTLPNDLLQATDKEQFTYCNMQLERELAKNPELEAQFSGEQLSQIISGETPDGYTWHHDSYVGHMQLVDMKTHQLTGHTGGRSIWGGGTSNR